MRRVKLLFHERNLSIWWDEKDGTEVYITLSVCRAVRSIPARIEDWVEYLSNRFLQPVVKREIDTPKVVVIEIRQKPRRRPYVVHVRYLVVTHFVATHICFPK